MFAPGFAPYAASENLVNSKLALAMINRGWDVSIISARDEGFNYGTDWVEPWLKLKQYTHEVTYEFGKPLNRVFQRLWSTIKIGYPIVRVRWAWEAMKLALDLHEKKPFNFVLSRSISCAAHLPAIAFTRKTSVPWIANWNDPPSFYLPPPYNPKKSFLNRFIWKRYYRDALLHADVNTFPCERLARYIMKSVNLEVLNNVQIIPHLTLDEFQPIKRGMNGSFKLCHAGNLSSERDPIIFLTAFKRLIISESSESDIKFEIIGVENVELNNIINNLGLQGHVTFTGGLGYLEALNKMTDSDVLVIIEAGCKTGIFLPSKLMDYVQVGRPILSVSPIEGTIKDILSIHGGGVAVDCTSLEDVYAGLKELYDSWKKNRLTDYLSKSLFYVFSAKAVLDSYEKLFSELSATT